MQSNIKGSRTATGLLTMAHGMTPLGLGAATGATLGDEFMLLTDDREALAEVPVHRPGLKESALEAIGEALTAPPVVKLEVFEKLRGDWTAVRETARMRGDIAYFIEGYTDVVARAAALSAIEDLPADILGFTDALLAEHGKHREGEAT